MRHAFAATMIFFSMILCACEKSAIERSPGSPAHQTTDKHSGNQIYDIHPPAVWEWMKKPAILVFSKTTDFRHNEGIAGANLFFVELAQAQGWGIFTTENAAIFNSEDLKKFSVIILNNMTGDALSPFQEDSFQSWLENGGGVIAIHGSGDASHSDWPYYANTLIGPKFIGHPAAPQFQEATVETLATDHPVMANMPTRWQHTDEWYSFDSRPQDHGLLPLVGLDETTYRPINTEYGDISDLRMGEGAINHPIVWASCPGKGRFVYSGLGHQHTTYNNEHHRRLLTNSFEWVKPSEGHTLEGCPKPDPR